MTVVARVARLILISAVSMTLLSGMIVTMPDPLRYCTWHGDWPLIWMRSATIYGAPMARPADAEPKRIVEGRTLLAAQIATDPSGRRWLGVAEPGTEHFLGWILAEVQYSLVNAAACRF